MEKLVKIGVIFAVLGIVLSITSYIVGPTVIWGAPLLEERNSTSMSTKISEYEVAGLKDSIIAISQSGKGARDNALLDVGKRGKVKVNPSENFIEISVYKEESSYPVHWQLIEGESRQGLSIGSGRYVVEGQSSPAAVAVGYNKTEKFVVYRIEFRNVKASDRSGPKIRKIDLQTKDVKEEGKTVEISYQNKGIDKGKMNLSSGRSVDLERKVIELDLNQR